MPVWRRMLARLRAVRHIEWALLLAAAAALLLITGTLSDSRQEGGALEQRMEAVLESVRGAGRVRVMVNSTEIRDVFSDGSSAQVVGVLVVAEGADDLKVAMALQQAVQTLLGIEASRIEILDMKEDGT